MKIAMFTNTYLPHVGGVARSVSTLEEDLRKAGHEVRVVAPEFEGAEESPRVLRVPAIQRFNGSDFSFRLPWPGVVRDFLEDFQPDLIHSHHPFLLGDAALREAYKEHVPLVFTHHTLYERYTHYVPFDSSALKRMAVRLATEFCNLSSLVVAPSESVAELLKERGVETRVDVIPTGIDLDQFCGGDGERCRRELGIPAGAKVTGHVGRLSPEKNLTFLAEAMKAVLAAEPEAVFLVVGGGESEGELMTILRHEIERARVFVPGKRMGPDLADAYAAMDCFVFASQTETQGIVLAEAMAARLPVVALDGPGVREIVEDGKNGMLLDAKTDPDRFAEVVLELLADGSRMEEFAARAADTARNYSSRECAKRMISSYERLVEDWTGDGREHHSEWDRIVAGIEVEWELFAARVSAAAAALADDKPGTEVVS